MSEHCNRGKAVSLTFQTEESSPSNAAQNYSKLNRATLTMLTTLSDRKRLRCRNGML